MASKLKFSSMGLNTKKSKARWPSFYKMNSGALSLLYTFTQGNTAQIACPSVFDWLGIGP
jgi:hypothetical protein